METFHPFCQLPLELREQIWTEAIRPKQLGVHFFTIYNADQQNEVEETAQHVIITSKKNHRRCMLAAPRCRGEELSWTSGNPSAYLLDRGLWTACRESRRMMEGHYEQEKRQKKTLAESKEKLYTSPDDTPAAVTIVSNGERQYFTVTPQLDLFCLRPLNHVTIDWDEMYHVPFFSPFFGYRSNHIALEWDPTWDDGESAWDIVERVEYDHDYSYGDTVLGSVIRACKGWDIYAENVWIIDSRIRRDSSETALPSGRASWTLGDGRKLVEVWEGDSGWTGVDVLCNRFVNPIKRILDLEYWSKDPESRWELYVGPTFRPGPQICGLAYLEP